MSRSRSLARSCGRSAHSSRRRATVGRGADRALPLEVDAEAVPVPGRDVEQHPRPAAARAVRAAARAPACRTGTAAARHARRASTPVTFCSRTAGHERVQHQAGARSAACPGRGAAARAAPARAETSSAGPVVALAEQVRHALEQPRRARRPTRWRAPAPSWTVSAQRAVAVRASSRPARTPVASQPVGRIAGAAAQRQQRRAEVERTPRVPRPLQHPTSVTHGADTAQPRSSQVRGEPHGAVGQLDAGPHPRAGAQLDARRRARAPSPITASSSTVPAPITAPAPITERRTTAPGRDATRRRRRPRRRRRRPPRPARPARPSCRRSARRDGRDVGARQHQRLAGRPGTRRRRRARRARGRPSRATKSAGVPKSRQYPVVT